MSVRTETKKKRQEAQVPAPRSYTVKVGKKSVPVDVKWTVDSVNFSTKLHGVPVVCNFKFGTAKVDRRVKMYGRVVRNDDGSPVLVKVTLPATIATLAINDSSYTATSVCKPPDRMNRLIGMKVALRHLFKNPKVQKNLDDDDFEALVKVFLTKPPKPSQIRRTKKLVKKAAKKSAKKGK